jgi:hypothetical protein
MLEEGHTREEAERAIGLLLKALQVLEQVTLDLTARDGRIDLNFDLRLQPAKVGP